MFYQHLLRAVSTTVADTLSGSTNASALAMAMKISLSMEGGVPRLRSHSDIVIYRRKPAIMNV